MSARRLLERPLPWHLLLAPAVPFGALQLEHLAVTRPEAMLGPTIAVSAIAVLLWLVLARVLPNGHTAALVITLVITATLASRTITAAALSLSLPGGALPIDLAILGALLLLLARPALALPLTRILNRGLALTVLLLVALTGHAEWSRPRLVVPALDVSLNPARSDPPDVYVLVLDGYGRADVLRDRYAFDNPLDNELRALGFFVGEAATSNYPQTALSLASALNVDYLQALVPDIEGSGQSRRGMGDLLDRNRVFGLFHDAGYDVRAYASAYNILRPGPVDARDGPVIYPTTFTLGAYETTSVPAVMNAAGFTRGWLPLHLHRRHVRWTLDDLERRASAPAGRPAFVFAHLLAPHPPFAFEADGSARSSRLPALSSDANFWQTLAAGSGETYEAGYAASVAFLNQRVLRIVRAILDSPRPAIVLIHSDHGPAAHLDWEQPDEAALRERYGILLAMRGPDGSMPGLPHDTTLVNAYRALLNGALRVDLPMLPDRAYFATWSRPLQFVDVTPRVRRHDGTGPRG